LAVFEAYDLVQSDIAQTGHKRNAVGYRFDMPDLLGDRLERRRFDALLRCLKPTVKIYRGTRHGPIPRGFGLDWLASYCAQ
jgi:hypothetical protein